MSKRPFVPSFLQKADDKLLRNNPGAWASRAHLVIYFAAAFAGLLFVFCYFVFFDAKQYSSIASWNVFTGLVVFIGFVFWIIYLLRFNVFKRYGNWSVMDGLRDFILYFISIGAMVAACFVPSAVETMRANQQFGNEEIVRDINELNINACKLEYALLPLTWDFDTCRIVNKINDGPVAVDDAVVETVTVDSVAVVDEHYVAPDYIVIDTAELRSRLENRDSLLKINDSLYVFYKCPNYRFVSSYNADDYSKVKMLGTRDIYNSTIKNYQKPDRNKLLKRMQELKTKYAVSSPYGDYYDNSENASYDVKINRKYSLNEISNGIDNTVRKKQAWLDDWPIFLRVFYYITLLLTMLVFIFRHSTAKTFFLSVLTAVLLAIITGLLMVIGHGDEVSVYSFMIFYYVVFAVLGLSVFSSTVRRAAQGIGLNLFLFSTPFVPLIFVALSRARHYGYYSTDNEYRLYDAEQTAMYYLIAEIAGSVVLLILIQPLFKKLYRKWYSAPEE